MKGNDFPALPGAREAGSSKRIAEALNQQSASQTGSSSNASPGPVAVGETGSSLESGPHRPKGNTPSGSAANSVGGPQSTATGSGVTEAKSAAHDAKGFGSVSQPENASPWETKGFRDVVKGTAKMKVTESPPETVSHDKHDNSRDMAGKSSQNKEPFRVNNNRCSGSNNHQSKPSKDGDSVVVNGEVSVGNSSKSVNNPPCVSIAATAPFAESENQGASKGNITYAQMAQKRKEEQEAAAAAASAVKATSTPPANSASPLSTAVTSPSASGGAGGVGSGSNATNSASEDHINKKKQFVKENHHSAVKNTHHQGKDSGSSSSSSSQAVIASSNSDKTNNSGSSSGNNGPSKISNSTTNNNTAVNSNSSSTTNSVTAAPSGK